MKYYLNLDQNWTLGSHIMAVEVSGYEIHNLTNPVIITFRKSKADKNKREKFSCVFWDFNIGGKTIVDLIGLPYFHNAQPNKTWSNNTRFIHELCLSLYDTNRLTRGEQFTTYE